MSATQAHHDCFVLLLQLEGIAEELDVLLEDYPRLPKAVSERLTTIYVGINALLSEYAGNA